MDPMPGTHDDEVAILRARVAELERQLAEQAARANAAVAAAQDRAYWLDRWQVDLNQVMAKPAAGRARAVMRALRAPYRQVVLVRRALRRG